MQNKANFPDAQMNVNKVLTKDYENNSNCKLGENKPNTNPNKANFRKAKMNVNFYSTKDYENISNWTLGENKPNTNPIKPNPPARYAIRNTQYEIQTQTKPISPPRLEINDLLLTELANRKSRI